MPRRVLERRRDEVRALARPLRAPADLDPLLERIGDAAYVLIGEASHGTADFYRWRAELTRRLVAERGFSFVAVEGEWPDFRRLHRAVTADRPAATPAEVLAGHRRWPTWMWANTEVLAFADWLREHNSRLPAHRRVGFHGLDVYSLWDSLRAVVDYVRRNEPDHLERTLAATRCFEPYAEDPRRYAWATLAPSSCEDAVVRMLTDLRSGGGDGTGTRREERFDAEQNAAVAAGAEAYYRAMVHGGPESWNIRDTHMTDTLDRLMAHHGDGAKAVVWEHNTHIGDARYTDMAEEGMVNVGQLVRERHAAAGVVLVGFGSYSGTVLAADRWGAPVRRLPVPAAREGSVEHLLHEAHPEQALYVFPAEAEQDEWLRAELGHRAIGVVYRPERERWGNYVPTVLGGRYDAFLALSATTALTALQPEPAGAADRAGV